MGELSHLDDTGAVHMVEISGKETTVRTAIASGVVRSTTEAVELLATDGLPKGDAVATARIAGIMAAKRTSDLIPLCHPIALSSIEVNFHLDAPKVHIEATARTTDRTGVEMEALTAVTVAGLALHDMIKAVDPAATIDTVRLESKEGGRSGTWIRTRDRAVEHATVEGERRE